MSNADSGRSVFPPEFIELLELLAADEDVDPESAARASGEILARAAEKAGMTITRIPHDVLLLRELLGRESDRGAALMAAAYLESELSILLGAFLVDDTRAQKALLSESGPLAAFSARIELAYLLGLVSPVGRRDLHLIRKIRNDFAHSPTNVSFDTEAIRSRCGELEHDVFDEQLSPRRRFLRVTMGVSALIHAAMVNLKRRTIRPSLDLREPGALARAKLFRTALDDEMDR